MSEPETQEVIVKPKLTDESAVVQDTGEYAMLFDSARFNQAQRVAKLFSESKLVPDHFRGSTASVFVALHMAMRMNLDPMMVMQKTYIIGGKPGMEAQLLIALVNARGPFAGPIQWRFEGSGKDRKCTAYAIHAKTGEICEVAVDWTMVEAEGWASKSGSKWKTMPDMMFRYRSATFLARLYCPEVIMGLNTADELQDIEVIDAEILPAFGDPKLTKTEKIKEDLKKRGRPPKAQESPQDASGGEGKGNGQVGNEGDTTAPTAITEAQMEELHKAPPEFLEEAYKACGLSLDLPLEELTANIAEDLLKCVRAK